MPGTDDPPRGIALSVGSAVLFAMSDATAKVLTVNLPAVEIGWLRYVVFVLMACVLVRRARPRAVRCSPALQVTRGLCEASAGCRGAPECPGASMLP